MDLIATLEILADAVNQLAELAKEQAIIIEQYQMIDGKDIRENRERLAELDDKLMRLGTFAWKRKEERG
jgi:hypothetical protein